MILFEYRTVSDLIPICTACAHLSQSELESAAARTLLARLYGEARERGATLPREMPKLLREAGGKPRFADGCAEFSLSHDGGSVFAVLAVGGARIGADLVSLERTVARARGVAARFFTEGELASLPDRDECSDEYREAFLRIWARKEAAVKLTGEGAAALARTDTARDAARAKPLCEAEIPAVGRALFEGEIMIDRGRFFATVYVEQR